MNRFQILKGEEPPALLPKKVLHSQPFMYDEINGIKSSTVPSIYAPGEYVGTVSIEINGNIVMGVLRHVSRNYSGTSSTDSVIIGKLYFPYPTNNINHRVKDKIRFFIGEVRNEMFIQEIITQYLPGTVGRTVIISGIID